MNERAEIPPPPPGFVLQADRGAFSQRNGPYFWRRADDGVEQAFFALARHCNGVGLVHGGMLAAFLDGLLAGATATATRATPVTVHLSVDYLNMGRAGDWILGQARLSRATREIAFAEGHVHVGGKVLARATGVFRLMRRREV